MFVLSGVKVVPGDDRTPSMLFPATIVFVSVAVLPESHTVPLAPLLFEIVTWRKVVTVAPELIALARFGAVFPAKVEFSIKRSGAFGTPRIAPASCAEFPVKVQPRTVSAPKLITPPP